MDIREFFFNYRSYTPIPLLIAMLILADPTPATLIGGFAIALTGELLRLWAVRHAGGATRTTSGVGGSVLITSGPFAYVRNPLYLGNFLLTTGLVLMAWAWMPWLLLLLWLLFLLQYGLIISREEEYLRGQFGAQYEEYVQKVPRFLPRLAPFKRQAVQVMSWLSAIKVEKNTLMSFLLVSAAVLVRWAW